MFSTVLNYLSMQQLLKLINSRSIALAILLTTLTQAAPAFEKRIFEGSQASSILDSTCKHFVIVTTSYNNQQWYLKNIISACDQEYGNFEIMFTDDCSLDKTGNLVEEYLENNPPKCKVTLIKNHTRCGALQNIYRSISWCKTTDIIVSLDGDDWLADNHVLSHLNSVYANDKVWMTHGQLQSYPSGEIYNWTRKMPTQVVKENSYRSYQNIPTHLRTFYAWLFRNIKLEDLLHDGSFFPVTWDMAFMLPMMELSGGNHAFIDKVLYIYNETNPINDFKINKSLQRALDLKIRAKNRYNPIKASTITQRSNKPQLPVSLFIISHDTPCDLKEFIRNLHKYVKPLDHIYVAWYAHSPIIEDLYKEVTRTFPEVIFLPCSTKEESYIKYLKFLRYLSDNDYVLIARDTPSFSRTIDLKSCVQALKDTQAYGFYFLKKLTETPCKSIDLDGNIKGWNFAYTPQVWEKNSPCMAALYKRREAMDTLLSDHCENVLSLPSNGSDKIGLFLEL